MAAPVSSHYLLRRSISRVPLHIFFAYYIRAKELHITNHLSTGMR